MVDAADVRALWLRLEPAHGFIYFAPEAALGYEALGLEGRAGYFASRSAAMGAVGAEVVIATFFNFNPAVVRAALPSAWEVTTPAAVLAARFEAADQAMRRMLGDLVSHPDLPGAAALLRKAAEACTASGRPIYAAHAAIAWPDAPHLELFHAITLLREFRGDGHVAALTLAGYDGVEALLSHAASGYLGVPASVLQNTRGWSDEAWTAGQVRMGERGHLLVDEAGDMSLSEEGRDCRAVIEAQTDAAALAPWSTLSDDEVSELIRLSTPFTKAIAKSMFAR